MKKIKPESVLLFYDYPQVFIAKDIVDLKYTCMAIDEDETGPVYLCTPISKKRHDKLVTSKIDLKEVFEKPEVSEFYKSKYSEDESFLIIEHEPYALCPPDLLPEKDLFFNNYDEVASKALEENTTISYASLSPAEAKDSPRIRTSKLSEFLTLYQNSIKYLTKLSAKDINKSIQKNETPFSTDVFGFSYGSFTVQIRSSYDGDLLGDNALLSAAFTKLNTFLESTSNANKAIDYLHSVKGHTASSLIKLLDFMSKNSCPMKHQWASPGMGQSHSIKVELSHIHELVELCRQRDDLTKEKLEIAGRFTSANSKTGSWTLETDDKEKFTGTVSPESDVTLHGIIIEKQKYKVSCEEKIEVILGTSKEVKQYYITTQPRLHNK